MKTPSIAPAYACIYPGLCEVAQQYGYALSIHGSVSTDLDLIAVPWTDDAAEPHELAHAIRSHAFACLTTGCENGNPERKPHGRLAYHLSIDSGACIDLSIVPKSQASFALGWNQGLLALAEHLDRKKNVHMRENWTQDPATGTWETRNEASEAWVMETEELIEYVRILAAQTPNASAYLT